MKKIIALLLVAVMVFSFAACSGDPSTSAKKSISVCLASEPDTIDPALNSAVDGATMLAHLFSGLAKWSQDADGKLVIEADAAKELVEGTVGADGKVTYVYTLKDGLKWSDGKEVKASDFVFAWNRAADPNTGSDYGYMFEVVDGYAEVTEMTDKIENGAVVKDEDGNAVQVRKNPDAKLNVTADDAAKTITVVLANAVAYWNELLAFPTYYPVREDVVANENWATKPETYICNGAYTITKWETDSVIVLTKNANFHDAAKVTMETIEFYLSDDSNNMLANFKSGDWLLIDDVPTNEIANLKTQYPDEFVVAGQIGTYYVNWNINQEVLPAGSTLTGAAAEAARAEIRAAFGLLLDRNYICETIAQGGQVPASSFVAMGMTDGDGTEFYKNAGTEANGGYYKVDKDSIKSNFDAAVATLKKYYTYDEATKKFTNIPSLTYLYNTSDSHKAIGEYLQQAFATVGITLNLENQEWATFLNTRKDGNYGIARNGWLADYNDPICFLDMWTSGSGNNDAQFGKGAHKNLAIYNLDLTGLGYTTKVTNGTWEQTYDVLITTIKACTDKVTRYKLMHIAEDMLMSTGCIVPLYYYTDLYMIDDSVEGFFSNPLGYKYFMYCTVK